MRIKDLIKAIEIIRLDDKKEFYKPDIVKERLHKMEIELIELSRKYE
jgi:hypothetical protein